MADNKPRSREKNVTGQGAGVHRRGEGLGTGPVGSGSNPTGRPQNSAPRRVGSTGTSHQIGSTGMSQQTGSTGTRAGGSKKSIILIIVVVVVVLLFGGKLTGLFGGGDSSTDTSPNSGTTTTATNDSSSSPGGLLSGLSSLLSGGGNNWSSQETTTWSGSSNTGSLNRNTDPSARDKFTTIKGNGTDQITIMVYVCGTDLESKSSMASRDLSEMGQATLSDNVNLIVCTGGCKQWKTGSIRTDINQVYQIKDGYLIDTGKNVGKNSMTDPNTLLSFIRYATEQYPANRYMLILWDHGGGSVSGYGYDETHPKSGSMTLASLSSVLKSSGIKYDLIGFDACLMATVENAAMLSEYADYLVASEETEPGIGWYYTDWLTALSKNPSMPTLDVGRQIVDDFITACNRQCNGQPTTLSVIDLAELGETLPDEMKAFSEDLKDMITGNEYQAVSTARGNSKEFASSNKIDQIDFVDFAQRIGSTESKNLVKTLKSAVKYNRTGSSVTNAYGLSVYFPLKKLSTVDKAVKEYDALGMDDSYSDCIRAFASMESSGQISTGGSSNSPYSSLIGSFTSGYTETSGGLGGISDLLSAAMSGNLGSILNLGGGTADFFSGRSMADIQSDAAYLVDNRFDPSQLFWQKNEKGNYVISMDATQWNLVQDVALNMFYDDGEGYVDLGLDNLFSIDDDGNLVPDTDGTWISLNNQPVAYYYMGTTEDDGGYAITGYVPAMLNGELVKLILIFNDENPYGFVAGAQPEYDVSDTETVSRGLIELEIGDRLDFVCDFYSYEGEYLDSYMLNEPIIYNGTLTVSDTILGGSARILYRFTDIYQQHYWSEALTIGK